MILHVMSDLHLDLLKETGRRKFFSQLKTRYDGEPEALVLAGDIANLRGSAPVLHDALQEFQDLYPQVIYVPGNHEFWGTGIPEGWAVLRKLACVLPRLTVLRVGDRLHGPLSFGGDTLWFPDCGDELQKRWWPDYNYVSNSGDIHAEHQKFRGQSGLPEVVVTHHFPTTESIAPEWRGSPNNCFFHADLDYWLAGLPPVDTRLWIHGHTHNPMDYRSTFGFRVYCNPLGYQHEGLNPDFWDRIRVDTDA